jgi:type VI protein secretion system component Hcp
MPIYLKLDGIQGDATSRNHKGSFVVDNFDFGVATSANLDGAETGGGAGKAQFGPLTLDIHSLQSLSTLLGDAVTGKVIKSAELIDVVNGKTIFDIKLTDVLISSLHSDPSRQGVETSLALNFGAVTVTDQPLKLDGRTAAPETFSFDLKQQGGGVGADTNAIHIVDPVPANSPLHYFLKIDGLVGNSTDAAHKGWFDVDGYDFAVLTSGLDPTGGGAGAGKTQFSPLSVDIRSLAGLAPLLADAATGKEIKSVELAGVSDRSDQTVYDLKLTDVRVGGIDTTSAGRGLDTSLKLDFGQVTLTDHALKNDGSIGPAETFSSSAGSTNGLLPAVQSAARPDAVPANSSIHYFLKIGGLTGDATDAAHKGWFVVDGYDFGVLTARDAASGLPTGKRMHKPFTVSLESIPGLAPLLGDAASGRDIGTIELVGVDTAARNATVFDLKLDDAQVASLANSPGAGGVETDLNFNFKNGSLTDRALKIDGSVGPAETVSFDGGTSTGLLPAVQAPPVDSVPADSPLHYFLKIDGITGDATDAAHKGWFTVDGFDVGVLSSIGSATSGAGAGKTQFSPLTIDIHSLAGLAPLLGDAASGKLIASVELAALDARQQKANTLFDLKLSDVSIDSLNTDPGAHGVGTTLALDFQKITVADQAQKADGSPGAAETFTFGGASALLPAVQFGQIAAVPANSPLHYFLKIDGVTGDSTDAQHKGWFTVDGYDFGAANPGVTAAGSGGGEGKPQFSPLTVDLSSIPGLATLFGDAVSGKHIASVELAAVDARQQKANALFDLKLTDVTIGSLQQDPGARGIETTLALKFQAVSLTDQTQKADGSPGQAETFSFDTQGQSSVPAVQDAADLKIAPVPANSALHYFLKIDGITGDSTDAQHKGWFTVDGYDSGVDNQVAVAAGSGAGAGKAQFSPLTVDIHSLQGLAPLLGNEVTGRQIKSVELVGVSDRGDQTVYDLKLSGATLSSLQSDPGSAGVETELKFNFLKISLTDQALKIHGNVGVAETFSFDTTLASTDGTPLPLPGNGADSANLALLGSFAAASFPNSGSPGGPPLTGASSPDPILAAPNHPT